MARGFSFDGALMFPFRAAHVRTFPWMFALSFALISTVLTGLMMYLARDAIYAYFDTIDSLIQASAENGQSEEAAMEMMAGMFGAIAQMLPLIIPGVLVSWIVWVMFETASQRRYMRDEPFSLGFGADEIRMLGTSFFWYLLMGVFFVIPALSGLSIFSALNAFMDGSISENELNRRMLGSAATLPLSMLVLFPAYAFFATRFSPCFGLTVKDRKVAFLDGWIVSRGRFWPILGAFLIISIGGGMVTGVIVSIAQMLLMPSMMNPTFMSEDVPTLTDLLKPGMMLAMLIYLFIRYFLSGLLMHFASGPAAFAARHDPRGGVDDAEQVAIFD